MEIHGLPDKVLAILLERSLARGLNKAAAFKGNLPLLSVCHRWRVLAVPLVYGSLFVQFGSRPKPGSGVHRGDSTAEEPTYVDIKTNLDLIAAVGCANMATSAEINVHYSETPFQGLKMVAERMCLVADKWRQIAELRIALHPPSFHSSKGNIMVADYADSIDETGDMLAALMPGLRRLSCQGVNLNLLARELYGRLAAHFAEQLQEIFSHHPLIVPHDRQFKCLKRVYISYDHVCNYRLPSMDGRELLTLRLHNGPPNHSWASFSTDDDSSVIEFDKLHGLSVAYHTSSADDSIASAHRDGNPWELHFPSLKNISIMSSRDTCPLLEYMRLPPRMDSITIDLKSSLFQSVAKLALPVAKRLKLVVDVTSDGDPSGLPFINRIIERANESDRLELDLAGRKLAVPPEIFTCTALTGLRVAGPTSVDAMFEFIRRLPNLVWLEFSQLTSGDILSDIAMPKASYHAPIEPFDTKLEDLQIRFGQSQSSPDMAIAVAKYLLLKLPALTILVARQIPMQPVVEFVDAHAEWYPNLHKIYLEIDKWK